MSRSHTTSLNLSPLFHFTPLSFLSLILACSHLHSITLKDTSYDIPSTLHTLIPFAYSYRIEEECRIV